MVSFCNLAIISTYLHRTHTYTHTHLLKVGGLLLYEQTRDVKQGSWRSQIPPSSDSTLRIWLTLEKMGCFPFLSHCLALDESHQTWPKGVLYRVMGLMGLLYTSIHVCWRLRLLSFLFAYTVYMLMGERESKERVRRGELSKVIWYQDVMRKVTQGILERVKSGDARWKWIIAWGVFNLVMLRERSEL